MTKKLVHLLGNNLARISSGTNHTNLYRWFLDYLDNKLGQIVCSILILCHTPFHAIALHRIAKWRDHWELLDLRT